MSHAQHSESVNVSLGLIHQWVLAFERRGGTPDMLQRMVDDESTLLRVIEVIGSQPPTGRKSGRKNVTQYPDGGLLTVPEVADRLRAAVSTVYALIEAGKLGAFRIGPNDGSIRVSLDQLQAYFNASSSLSPSGRPTDHDQLPPE